MGDHNRDFVVPEKYKTPVAEQDVSVMLFEPATPLNTGNNENEVTKCQLDKL